MTGPAKEALPVTVLLPETAADAIVMVDVHAALRLALVERDAAHLLDPEWDVPGVYILLDLPAPDGTWGVYIGKAPGGVRTRITDHLRQKDHWRRALLIQRDTRHGWNSAQVAWLEGRFYNLLEAAEDARLQNKNRPSDETLPSYERAMLEASVLPVTRVLRLIGYDPVTADDSGTTSTTTRARRASRFYGITLKNLIADGLLPAGTAVMSVNGAWPASGTVDANGGITVNGKTYPSVSTAASAVKGGAANGWDFWAIADGTGKTTLATLRSQYLAAHPPTATGTTP